MSDEAETDLLVYLAERDDILRSLDVDRFVAFTGSQSRPPNRLTALTAMHKARLHIASMTPAERKVSTDWLNEHNLSYLA